MKSHFAYIRNYLKLLNNSFSLNVPSGPTAYAFEQKKLVSRLRWSEADSPRAYLHSADKAFSRVLSKFEGTSSAATFSPHRPLLDSPYFVRTRTLTDLDLLIPEEDGYIACSHVAHVGPKGSGKTTVQNQWLSERHSLLESRKVFFVRCDAPKIYELYSALTPTTGNLGRHVASQTLENGWPLSVAVRNRGRLSPEVAARAQVTDLDLASVSTAHLASFAAGHDVLVSCAGLVTEGEAFVHLVDTIVSALESLRADERPVCWFLAGAALLPLDAMGRLGVDLPKVRGTYWPHRRNFERLQRSELDWRLLCPGPMVEQPAIGLPLLRVAVESLPAPLPAFARSLPAPLLLPLFAMKIPEMIIPYADAASVILANVERGDLMSRKRVGVALPVGMKGRKNVWAAQPRKTG